MTTKQLIQLLVELGLRDGEARVYRAALALGPTSILKLARAAELKRTTVYSLVEDLQQKGLMNVEVRGFKQRFVAAPPQKLELILDERREALRMVLPDLTSLYHLKGGDTTLRYYQGLKAVKAVYEELLQDVRAHEDYLVMTDLRQWLALDQEYFLDFIRRRAKLPLKIRMLVQDSPVGREHQRLQKTYNEVIRLLPPGTQLTTNLVIIPQRVVIHQLTPPVFAIVIQHPSVVQMHREQFEIMWRSTGL